MFQGRILQEGVVVWRCGHAHKNREDAQACAAGEKLALVEYEFVQCLSCKQRVDYMTEHYDLSAREWSCTFVLAGTPPAGSSRKRVSSLE